MPHSNVQPKTRMRAKTLRRELTMAERRMWDILRCFRGRGARFRRETPIGPYIADFAWLSARIIIEVDGDTHATASGIRHDQDRDTFLRGQGFHVIRFDNSDVIFSEEAVYLEIEAALQTRLIPALS
ncbi:endonuclease domain-containing protein [Phyllobacterium chamaecytisi]|uniref:endonuclease domain-containing protein n=1 Tax=Phyllobacterium chamaecytisi TaxID=2876082 RepID=UPI001CCFB7E1|nr:endonuclease domain-containing protein [Phyllobacterium sp. KW56]MBZ9605165.1 endonuclease domain-containing protein [Phyllobacterium sp. KW56]